jgi:hypothetical protein
MARATTGRTGATMDEPQAYDVPETRGQRLVGLRLVVDCALTGIGGLALQLFIGVLRDGERGRGSSGFLFADMAGARYVLWLCTAIAAVVALGAAADIVRAVFHFVHQGRQ